MNDSIRKAKKPSKLTRILLSIILLLCVLALLGYGGLNLINSRDFQFFGGLVQRVNTTQKVVALTLDDGPEPGNVEKTLQILDETGIKATFFLIGDQIEKYPQEARKIVKAGHELGNHSYSHQRMVLKSYDFMQNEVEKTDRLLRAAGYQGPIYFRPPNGKKFIMLPYYLSQHQRLTIMWDVEPDSYADVASTPQKLADYTIAHVQPGSIIDLHTMYESRATSLEALPLMIKGLQKKGYTFVTVEQLLKYNKAGS
ncbi:polysaccharide deacetylase [Ktedonosporobacter rubrisoli]|uniref:Polysaccharide deacetylase n=1 Tax=Ktedonosporobacter rubrisoli TaxID=2509675 RepID=A0A4P6JV27_KTERU|nr:polysaccharide deacetylase family protein [Ktedonosporobacter rubrisoli]QBD79509.1 polysaccharide deacetylase [Ktedonosporobacter rubrisoli]